MGNINVLEPNVFNMISAGEVVERPASVVKELVENSIDAGSTQVDIYIEEGGIRRIQVSDNGIGILKEDMRKAFLPHATSKLKNITDLDSLSTLGFRGEALASISAVSETTLVSISRNQSEASKIVVNGGKVVEECIANRTCGTIITVDNLFFNTPARLKFLKKATSEQRYVQDIVQMLIFANPSVNITLSCESGTLLRSDGGDLIDGIYSVYGAKIADNLLEVQPKDDATIKVCGYVSKVDFVKPNRTYQNVIINGRAVQDVTIQTAVEKAYAEFLMKRTYPLFVLDVLMPFEDVDVNVHPSKTEVRFRDKHAVFSAVYHAVKDTIDKSLLGASYGFSTGNGVLDSAFDENIEPNNNKFNDKTEQKFMQTSINTKSLFSGKTTPKGIDNFAIDNEIFDEKPYSIQIDYPKFSFANKPAKLADSPVGYTFDTDFTNSLTSINPNECVNNNINIFDGKIVGQIFSTYLICERDNIVYLIDQHAAHERILYDNIIDRFNVEYKQPLLIPYKLALHGEEEDYFEKIIPNLQKLGFDVELTNGSYLINSVPEPVVNVNFSKFFADLFANMLDEEDLTLENLLKDKLCQQACKAAIKGGETLSREQIERVISNYVDKDGNLPSKCPHGRPAVIAFSARDIEKLFKRIV